MGCGLTHLPRYDLLIGLRPMNAMPYVTLELWKARMLSAFGLHCVRAFDG